MDKALYVFNTYFFNFISEVAKVNKAVDHELFVLQRAKHMDSTKHLIRFTRSLSPEVMDALTKTDIVTDIVKTPCIEKMCFLKSSKGAVRLEVGDLLKDVAGLEERRSWTCYLLLLALFAHVYRLAKAVQDADSDSDSETEEDRDVSLLFDHVIAAIKSMQAGEEPPNATESDSIVCDLLQQISKTLAARKLAAPDVEALDEETQPPLPSFLNGADDALLNTKIGSVAKEICEELDLSALQGIEKPEDILKVGFGGEKNILGNLISKIGQKVHHKISTGELRHEDLMSETLGMLNMMNTSGGSSAAGSGGAGGGMAGLGSLFNSPMFQEVMKNFGGNGAKVGINHSKVRTEMTRDRLRKKMEARRSKPL